MDNSFFIIMLLVILFSVLFNQSSKIYFSKSLSIGASTIIAQISAALGALVWMFFFPLDFHMSIKYWGFLLLASVFYALNDRFGADVKKHLDVSVFSLLNKTSDVFLIIISIIFFKELPGLWKIISAILIIFGQVVLSYKKGKIEFDKYFLLALFTNFIFSIAISIDIGISLHINLPVYIALTLLIPALFIGFIEKIKLSKIMSEYVKSNKFLLLLVGFSWGSLIVVSLRAYQLGSIISVIIINAIAVIINVLIGIFIQRENGNFINKIIAMVLVALGVLITILK